MKESKQRKKKKESAIKCGGWFLTKKKKKSAQKLTHKGFYSRIAFRPKNTINLSPLSDLLSMVMANSIFLLFISLCLCQQTDEQWKNRRDRLG